MDTSRATFDEFLRNSKALADIFEMAQTCSQQKIIVTKGQQTSVATVQCPTQNTTTVSQTVTSLGSSKAADACSFKPPISLIQQLNIAFERPSVIKFTGVQPTIPEGQTSPNVVRPDKESAMKAARRSTWSSAAGRAQAAMHRHSTWSSAAGKAHMATSTWTPLPAQNSDGKGPITFRPILPHYETQAQTQRAETAAFYAQPSSGHIKRSRPTIAEMRQVLSATGATMARYGQQQSFNNVHLEHMRCLVDQLDTETPIGGAILQDINSYEGTNMVTSLPATLGGQPSVRHQHTNRKNSRANGTKSGSPHGQGQVDMGHANQGRMDRRRSCPRLDEKEIMHVAENWQKRRRQTNPPAMHEPKAQCLKRNNCW